MKNDEFLIFHETIKAQFTKNNSQDNWSLKLDAHVKRTFYMGIKIIFKQSGVWRQQKVPIKKSAYLSRLQRGSELKCLRCLFIPLAAGKLWAKYPGVIGIIENDNVFSLRPQRLCGELSNFEFAAE